MVLSLLLWLWWTHLEVVVGMLVMLACACAGWMGMMVDGWLGALGACDAARICAGWVVVVGDGCEMRVVVVVVVVMVPLLGLLLWVMLAEWAALLVVAVVVVEKGRGNRIRGDAMRWMESRWVTVSVTLLAHLWWWWRKEWCGWMSGMGLVWW